MKQPNILFITDDQHRYDFLSMTGKFPVNTPNLSRLAEEGIWHRAAFSPCPLCMPARCSLHNGLYAHQHGINQNISHWPLDLPSMPRSLQQLGYHTAAIGKLHVYEGVPEKLNLTRPDIEQSIRSLGYDHLHETSGKGLAYSLDCQWTKYMESKGLLEEYRAEQELRGGRDGLVPFNFADEDHMDAYIADHCVEWLEQVDTAKPFFLWAGLVSPHGPYDTPASFLEHYPPEEQPLPIDNDEIGHWPLRRSFYAGMVEMVDTQVGRMLEVLENRGILDDTVVIFTADHGEMLGDHGLNGKCYAYDPSTRVPLLVRWPKTITPGSISDSPVEITDVTATCIHIASGDSNIQRWLPRSPAKSLLPIWERQTDQIRDFVYSEDGGQFFPAFQMIRTREWKYVLYVDQDREELFDMVNDPDECTNLAGSPQHCDIREQLKRNLITHIAQTPSPVP